MSGAGTVARTQRERWIYWFKEKAAYGWTIASGLIGVGGLWVDELSFEVKLVLCIFIAGLAFVSFRGYKWRADREKSASQRAREAQNEADRLRDKLKESAPDKILDTVGTALFVKPGAWRLTLFVLEQKSDHSWCLKPLITRASSEVFESAPHLQISLTSGPLREILDVDVSDPVRPFANESASLPDRRVDPDLWNHLSTKVLQRRPDPLGMATRKFAWTATKEPSSRRTFVLLGESVLPDGIQPDVVRSQLLAATIGLISRMCEPSSSSPEALQEPKAAITERQKKVGAEVNG